MEIFIENFKFFHTLAYFGIMGIAITSVIGIMLGTMTDRFQNLIVGTSVILVSLLILSIPFKEEYRANVVVVFLPLLLVAIYYTMKNLYKGKINGNA